MNSLRRKDMLRAGAGLVLAALAGRVPAFAQPKGKYMPMDWLGLLPPGWDPKAVLQQAQIDPRMIGEGSEAEWEAWKRLRHIWDNAPVRTDLDGQAIRMAGYVVAIEQNLNATREFLLVPYYGACIHSPPPPINQIVLVRMNRPTRIASMDVVWVWGTLSTQRRQTYMGSAGYSLQAQGLSEYKP